jgi:hypothetical protein
VLTPTSYWKNRREKLCKEDTSEDKPNDDIEHVAFRYGMPRTISSYAFNGTAPGNRDATRRRQTS